jgi:hypothetical protein
MDGNNIRSGSLERFHGGSKSPRLIIKPDQQSGLIISGGGVEYRSENQVPTCVGLFPFIENDLGTELHGATGEQLEHRGIRALLSEWDYPAISTSLRNGLEEGGW